LFFQQTKKGGGTINLGCVSQTGAGWKGGGSKPPSGGGDYIVGETTITIGESTYFSGAALLQGEKEKEYIKL